MTNTNGVQKEILPNGLVVITEPMEYFHSVSVGIWLRSGSRREPAELNGISHFIEHMVFKGTRRRSAEDIAREVDRVGGMLDAFTAKEMVCFNTRVLAEHLPKAFDVLADMVLEPRFAQEDIDREKSVVLEEIRMTQRPGARAFRAKFLAPASAGQADSGYPGNGFGADARNARRLVYPLLRAEQSGDHCCRAHQPPADGRYGHRALFETAICAGWPGGNCPVQLAAHHFAH
jgi:predicted Zn-dependent peptidase